MKKLKLPDEIFVRMEQDGEESYLLAFEEKDDAVEDGDDSTEVGLYQLADARSFRKVTVVVEEED